MSAIEPLGYPDWQRLTNWDGPVLWKNAPYVGQGPVVSPVMRVDRYNSVAGVLELTAGQAVVGFGWYADQALTTLIGGRNFLLDGDASATMLYGMLNMAAWLKVTVQRITAPDINLQSGIAALSNRAFLAASQPEYPAVIAIQNVPVAAGATNVYPSQYVVGGKAHLWANGSPGKIYAGAWTMDVVGNYELIAQGITGADGNLNLDFAAPPGSIQVRVTNIDGVAHNIYTSLVYYES